MVEQAVRRIAEELAAKAPAGWTGAVLASTAGRGGASAGGGYTVTGQLGWQPRIPSPFKDLMSLAEQLREARGWERVSLELRCRPTGEYDFVAFADTVIGLRGQGGGFQVVLDPGYRLPQPGHGQEAGAAVPAGDPESAVARLREYLQRRAAILGRPERLPPPVSAAALDEVDDDYISLLEPTGSTGFEKIVAGQIPDQVPAGLQAIHINTSPP